MSRDAIFALLVLGYAVVGVVVAAYAHVFHDVGDDSDLIGLCWPVAAVAFGMWAILRGLWFCAYTPMAAIRNRRDRRVSAMQEVERMLNGGAA